MRAAVGDWVRGVAVQVAVAKEWAAEVVAQVTNDLGYGSSALPATMEWMGRRSVGWSQSGLMSCTK